MRADAQTRVSIGVTETIETHNPYGDSVSLLYGIFSEITGPFCTYNYAKGDFEGRLAERWKIENPTTWIFYLSKNYKFNDGSPVTADDVVHSMMNRVIDDPQSKQKASVAPSVTKAEAVDKFTVKITTDKPTAPLLSFLCDRLIVTSKAAFDKYGRDVADKEHMMGGGPYRLKELIPGQRLVLQKRPDHPDAKKNPRAPDEVVYRIMREPEQRVTALLNDEIQIAQFIPPHMRQRVEKITSLRITRRSIRWRSCFSPCSPNRPSTKKKFAKRFATRSIAIKSSPRCWKASPAASTARSARANMVTIRI